MLTPEDRTIISGSRLLQSIPVDLRDGLLEGAAVVTAERGSVIFREGDRARNFFAVSSGWVKIFRNTGDGDQAVLGVFGPGETFAEAAAFVKGVYPANAAVVEEARLIEFSQSAFSAKVSENPRLAFALIGALARHLHEFTRTIERLQTRNAEQRLAGFLLDLLDEGKDNQVVELPYEKALIAGRLGMKPESLSRALSRLSAHGVSVSGNAVTIQDRVKLENVSDLAPLRRG